MHVTNHLIIFIKNPELGKVKTRIAATAGDKQALAIYKQLLDVTKRNTQDLDSIQKHLFYSDAIDTTDDWPTGLYLKHLQANGDLGHKMKMAFKDLFSQNKLQNKLKVLIIGSDCPEVSDTIISQSFELLNNFDVVLGPTYDGGYYLLGMNDFYPFLFDDIAWSTEDVFGQTIQIISDQNLTYTTMPKLHDMDTEEDWNGYQKRSKS